MWGSSPVFDRARVPDGLFEPLSLCEGGLRVVEESGPRGPAALAQSSLNWIRCRPTAGARLSLNRCLTQLAEVFRVWFGSEDGVEDGDGS